MAHIGNFAAELFCNQGHLGGLFAACDPAFAGLPASRHEGACASGSLAQLAASADIEAGRYGLAAVLGVEQMRNVPGEQAAQYIGGPAMWAGHEYQDARYPWPRVFSDVARRIRRRFGLKKSIWRASREINFANAKPNRMRRRGNGRSTRAASRDDDEANPLIEAASQAGLRPDHRWRRHRWCWRPSGAREHAKRAGHQSRSARRASKVGAIARRAHASPPRSSASAGQQYVFPHVRGSNYRRVRSRRHRGVEQIDAHRDARLLHVHRVHGDRSFRHHGAGPELARDRGRRRSRSAAHSRQSQRRTDRRAATRSARPACAWCSTASSR